MHCRQRRYARLHAVSRRCKCRGKLAAGESRDARAGAGHVAAAASNILTPMISHDAIFEAQLRSSSTATNYIDISRFLDASGSTGVRQDDAAPQRRRSISPSVAAPQSAPRYRFARWHFACRRRMEQSRARLLASQKWPPKLAAAHFCKRSMIESIEHLLAARTTSARPPRPECLMLAKPSMHADDGHDASA